VSTGSPILSLTSLLYKSVLPCMYCVRSTLSVPNYKSFQKSWRVKPLLQIGPFVPVQKGHLSRFWNRDSAAGRVVEPGQNVPHAKNFCALRNSNPRSIVWRMASLPTHLSSTCDLVKNNFLFNYHMEGPFVRVGKTNRDKRVF